MKSEIGSKELVLHFYFLIFLLLDCQILVNLNNLSIPSTSQSGAKEGKVLSKDFFSERVEDMPQTLQGTFPGGRETGEPDGMHGQGREKSGSFLP